MSTQVEVLELPECIFCKENKVNRKAKYDGKTIYGAWAYMCEHHYDLLGIGLGTGRGHKLILTKEN